MLCCAGVLPHARFLSSFQRWERQDASSREPRQVLPGRRRRYTVLYRPELTTSRQKMKVIAHLGARSQQQQQRSLHPRLIYLPGRQSRAVCDCDPGSARRLLRRHKQLGRAKPTESELPSPPPPPPPPLLPSPPPSGWGIGGWATVCEARSIDPSIHPSCHGPCLPFLLGLGVCIPPPPLSLSLFLPPTHHPAAPQCQPQPPPS
ncbi:hypothetical protein F4780DRAFT_627319 [Xylariomycetidae sp. FL0641]|nr:hypothetical protein F4780DRAFT_627319 [Xylariomycetidae sp. FL0641]